MKLNFILNINRAVFKERFKRILMPKNNKPTFIYGDGNWVSLLNDAAVTYNNNKHITVNMSPVDASDHQENLNTHSVSRMINPSSKVGDNVDYVRNTDKRNIFSKGGTPNWNTIF